jgi:hypothetical protein
MGLRNRLYSLLASAQAIGLTDACQFFIEQLYFDTHQFTETTAAQMPLLSVI